MGEMTPPLGVGMLTTTFFKIGAQAFGGWSTTALLIKRTGLVTPRELRMATTYAQVLPGATQVALVASVGYRLKGLRGAAIATVCYLLPASLLLLSFAMLYFHIHHLRFAQRALVGVSAILAGVIFANAIRLGAAQVTISYLWLMIILSCVLRLSLRWNAAALILGCGVLGWIFSWVRDRKGARHATH